MSSPNSSATLDRRHRALDGAYVCAAIGTVILLFWQIFLGTSFYFAFCVAASITVVAITLSQVGFFTVPGLLISYFAFRYFVFPEVLKSILGQPGDSNLAAPETTITVIFVFTVGMCAAALVVSSILRDRVPRALVQASPHAMRQLGFVSFALGLGCILLLYNFNRTDTGGVVTGGIIGAAKQITSIALFGIAAETWSVLMRSGGRHSVSPALVAMITIMSVIGMLGDSKLAVSIPYLIYAFSTIAYRRRVTFPLLTMTLGGAGVFLLILYPAIHILRAEGSGDVDATASLLEEAISDPAAFNQKWDVIESEGDTSRYGWGTDYAGSSDALLGRFLFIANTDVIVNGVNEDGPYGMQLLTAGFELATPSFILPDKSQLDTGDILTWHYGLRDWGVVGYVAVGLPADCYAAAGWLGLALIPFFLLVPYFFEMQLAGRRLQGNIVAVFLTVEHLHSFGEQSIQGFVTETLRGIPQLLIVIMVLITLVNFFNARRSNERFIRQAMGALPRSLKGARALGSSYASRLSAVSRQSASSARLAGRQGGTTIFR